MKKLSVNSPEYRDLVSKLLGKEVKFEDLPEVPIPKSPAVLKALPAISSPSRSPPKQTKKSAPKKVAKKNKYYISEETFDTIAKDFYKYFKKEFDWRTSVELIEVHIENMYIIREIMFYLTVVLGNDFSKKETQFVNDRLMETNYGNASSDIKEGNLQKVSSDLVIGFFDPVLLETLEENDIKIVAPLYIKDLKGNITRNFMNVLSPHTHLSPTLNDDT